MQTLGDGDYQFNYIIYREHIKDGSNLSMANEAFEHPGILVVKNGVGMIYLRIKNLTAKSPFSLQNITGKAVGCQYMVNGEFIPAEMNEDVVAFPAAVLNFVNIGDNLNQTLHGSVCLKMKCSVTAAHMPEAVAIFSMLHSTWNLTSDSKKTIILSEASLYRHYEKAAERSKKRRSLKDGTEDSKENCIAFGLRD